MRRRDNSVPHERFKFWDSLLDKSDNSTNLFHKITVVSKPNAVHSGIGKAGISLGYIGRDDKTWVQLTINIKSKIEETEKIYNDLLTISESIDKKYPELKIVWQPSEKNTINSRIVLSYSDKGGIGDNNRWEVIQDDLVDRMIKFEKIFKNWLGDYIG